MNKKIRIITMLLSVSLFFSFFGCEKKVSITRNWMFDTTKNTAGVKLQYKNNLYVTAGEYLNENSPNHLIICLDIKTGKVKWKYDIGKSVILHRIKLYKSSLYIIDTNDKVTWLNAITGNKIKKQTTTEIPEIKMNHLFNGNKVVAVAGNEAKKRPAKIVCRDSSGNVVWSYEIKPILSVKEPYQINFSFLIDGQNLILGTYDGKIMSFAIKLY